MPSPLERAAEQYYRPAESILEWVEEKECRTGDCTFIGEVDVTVWSGTGKAVEWDCEECGAHHVEDNYDDE